jgi:serine/threonine-protein kinase
VGALEVIEQAIGNFEQAIARDPNYALAYAALAFAYTEIGLSHVSGSLRPMEAYRRARIAVTRALELDGALPEAHATLAFLRFTCDFDWIGAEQEFKRALELDPNSGATCDAYGFMLTAIERYDEALEMQRRAHELEPVAYRLDVVTTYLRAGRYEEALRIATHAIELDPHFVKGHAALGWALIQTGQAEQGLTELERAASLEPGSPIFLGQFGEALALTGRTSEARKTLERMEELSRQRYVSPYHFAYVYTGLGELDTAMDLLEQAYEERAGGINGIKGSFLFAPLRSHPRFTALLKRMNLA